MNGCSPALFDVPLWFVQLEEDDSPWDFDSLLQTVTQEFNAEQRSAFNSQGQEDIDEVGRSDLRAAPSLRLQGGSRFSRALVS